MARQARRPALDVRGPANEQSPLPLLDAVAAVVDDFAPFAIDAPAPGRVRVYFTTETDRDAARAALAAVSGPRVRTSVTSVADQNWAARSQADLRSIQVGRVVIAPPWDLPIGDTDVVVEIRPALGFGSGHHPTTRLALLGLQQVTLHGRDVLDLGTGSGVLAIAAVKLGARQATGVDRDPDALASANESVAANHVISRVALRNADVAQVAGQLDTVAVIVANLTGATLVSLAPVITTLVEPGGYIVLGGILAEEEAAVARAYRAGAYCVWRAVEHEWVGMIWKTRPH